MSYTRMELLRSIMVILVVSIFFMMGSCHLAEVNSTTRTTMVDETPIIENIYGATSAPFVVLFLISFGAFAGSCVYLLNPNATSHLLKQFNMGDK